MTTVYADTYGFKATDATAALQAAIDSGADKVIVRNQGTPWLVSKTIRLKSNQEIIFEADVVVKPISNSTYFLENRFALFQARGLTNIKLIGEGDGVHQATLAMNKNEFSVTNNSYGHIIGIQGTDNYTISGLTLTGAGGDGIIIDSYSYGTAVPTPNTLNYSDHGLIDNVTATDNRRNGLSVISAQNLIVQNSKFTNSSDEAPATGIDFEPDFSYNRLKNITVKNVDLSGNQGTGLSFILSALDDNSIPTSITIDGAKIDNNQANGIKVGTYQTSAHPNSNAASSTPNGVINISNVTIAGTKEINTFGNERNAAISIQALSGDPSEDNLKVNFSNVAISNTGINTANPQLSAEPIFIRGFGGPTNRNQIGNLSFDNVTVADNFNRNIIGIYLNQIGSFNNITGDIRGINPNGVTSYITPTATQNNFTLAVTSATSPVVGTSGNDTFNPGKGAIAIDGGAGNDTLILDNSADIANTTINYTDPTNGEIIGGFNIGMTFKGIERVMFTSGSSSANINVSAATGNNKIDVSAATGSSGNVDVTTGSGDDTIIGSLTGTFNNYNGGNGDDVLTAGGGSGNTYNGGAGDDTLIAGGGADTFAGSSGNDTYLVDSTTSTITEAVSDGTDTVRSSVTFSLAALANVENLTLTGTTAINATGNAGKNTLIGNNAANILDGAGGIDTLVGGIGSDIYIVDSNTNTITEVANQGTDTVQSSVTFSLATLTNVENLTLTGSAAINATGNAGNNVITGNSGNNTLVGDLGNDTLNGDAGNDYLAAGAGNDILNGGEGNDTLDGGIGDDTLTGDAGNDVLRGGAGADVLSGGDGIDYVSYYYSTTAVTADLTTPTNNTGDATGDTFFSIENLQGSLTANSTLTGDGNNNTIVSYNGNDTLSGNAGNDYLAAGAGNDTLNGGEGNDYLAAGADDDILNGGDGNDYLGAGTGNDTLNGGEGSDTLVGDLGDDTLNGDAGNDVLRGGAGADTLSGGDGIDHASYYYSTTAVTVDLTTATNNAGDAAGDTFNSIENLQGARTENSTLTGDGNNNTIVSYNGDDTLNGNAGNDYLAAGNGNDTLNGGEGNDTLVGDLGDDTLSGNAGNDVLRGGVGADVLSGGDGIDYASYYYSTTAVTVDLTTATNNTGDAAGDTFNSIENLQGSLTANSTLTGDGNNNTIVSYNGDDTLSGNAGNDYLGAGAGKDTLNGGEGNDTLDGGTGDDTLNGNAGNDVLRGGAGTDVLNGGDGIDYASYYYSTTAVTVDLSTATNNTGDAAGDTFNSIENLQGSLTANSTLTGDGNNNTIVSYNGNDTLSGNAGNDYLAAGAGNDTLNGGEGNDILVGDLGDDTLNGDAGNDYLSAGAGNDIFNGGDGNDILNGGDGNDTLSGGDGNDVYNFSVDIAQGTDVITEIAGAGTDTLAFTGTAAVNIDLSNINAQNVSANLVLTVINIENINGSSGNDFLAGNSQNNILTGGAGSDTFIFGNSGTTSLADLGLDTIRDFTANDQIQLNNSVFNLLNTGALTSFESVATDIVAKGSSGAIVYSRSTGNLFYNTDGDTANFGAGGQFAKLSANLTLTAGSFEVIGSMAN